MAYWLMKSEPDVYPWERLVREKRGAWDGVRNYQANNNMKAMKVGDEAFFYHSNVGKEIVGIMKIVKTWYPDPAEETGRFCLVDVAPVKAFENPVGLAAIKEEKSLQQMAFVRQGRLSVSPVTATEWKKILGMAKK